MLIVVKTLLTIVEASLLYETNYHFSNHESNTWRSQYILPVFSVDQETISLIPSFEPLTDNGSWRSLLKVAVMIAMSKHPVTQTTFGMAAEVGGLVSH